MPMQEAEFVHMVGRKRKARMERIDSMTPELRALVHEYGLAVVDTLLQQGVTKPRKIKHVVETILNEFSPTRGSYSIQGGARKNIDTGAALEKAPSLA